MPGLNARLERELESLREDGLERRLRPVDGVRGPRIRCGGRTLLSFASNDYLGLAAHPALAEAAREAAGRHGAGAGASRLITGSLPPHRRLEEELARFKGTEAAIAFSSGYQAAVGALACLAGPGDTILSDRLNHACLIDGARLSGARIRVYRHNDMDHLEEQLRASEGQRLIVSESVFSMDGDRAPLEALASLRDRHGAWLMVDEAHATGIFGTRRSGLAEATGTAGRIDIQMGTLSKAIGSGGGYICGSRTLIRFLHHKARSFLFSTAPPPATAAAACAALALISSSEGAGRARRLWRRVGQLRKALGRSGPDPSPIVPLIAGCAPDSLALSAALEREGILVPAIRYPTVPRGQSRLRITLSASHGPGDVDRLAQALERCGGSPEA